MDSEQDRQRLVAVQAGDRRALADLYDRHAPAMLGLALRLLGDRQDAEDLVHDVFVEAWRKAASFSAERGTVRAWLLIRVRSRAIDRVRSASVVRRHAARERSAPSDPSERASIDPSLSVDQRRAREALASLNDGQRKVLELSYFEGLSCSEIAQRCDTPLGTVKSRLAAGLRELRRCFEAKGEESS